MSANRAGWESALGNLCDFDQARFSSLPYDAISDMPVEWSPCLRMENEHGSDLYICSDDVTVDGKPLKIELGVAITSEQKKELPSAALAESIHFCTEALKQSIWQIREMVRLGCFHLKDKGSHA